MQPTEKQFENLMRLGRELFHYYVSSASNKDACERDGVPVVPRSENLRLNKDVLAAYERHRLPMCLDFIVRHSKKRAVDDEEIARRRVAVIERHNRLMQEYDRDVANMFDLDCMADGYVKEEFFAERIRGLLLAEFSQYSIY